MNAANYYFMGIGDKGNEGTGQVALLGSLMHSNTNLSPRDKNYLSNKLRIQGALHTLCLFLKGVESYLSVVLPNPIRLAAEAPGPGFVIRPNEPTDTCSEHPLFFLSSSTPLLEIGQPLTQSQELALVLLDRNVQWLNMLVGHSDVVGA